MNFTSYVKSAEKLVVDNSPAILSFVGAAGVVTTAYLTGKATVKAVREIDDLEEHVEEGKRANLIPDVTDLERLELVWRFYIPAVSTGALSIVCIIGANQIGNRRAAAMAAAYTLSDKTFREYKEKVAEKFGEKKEQAVRDDLAQDQVRKHKEHILVSDESKVLCFDSFSGRYFESKMEDLKWAQNALNHRILNDYYASLGDLYNLLGLPPTQFSEELGWNCDELLEFEFSTVLSDDGKPCISIAFNVMPIRNYYRIH